MYTTLRRLDQLLACLATSFTAGRSRRSQEKSWRFIVIPALSFVSVELPACATRMKPSFLFISHPPDVCPRDSFEYSVKGRDSIDSVTVHWNAKDDQRSSPLSPFPLCNAYQPYSLAVYCSTPHLRLQQIAGLERWVGSLSWGQISETKRQRTQRLYTTCLVPMMAVQHNRESLSFRKTRLQEAKILSLQ